MTEHPFGTMLRAARMRFVWVESMQAWMRTQATDRGFRVELRPELKGNVKGGGMYYWMTDAAEIAELVEASPVLRNIKRVHRAFEVVLNGDGGLVR